MVVQRKQTDNKGMFYVEYEGEVHARMFYHMTAPNKMVIEHTEVDDELRGQNVGYQLVEAGVEYARQHNIKITVWCPFAKSVFNKKPDWHDVLDK
jgi:predicted GNAT family acetyltransferase